MKINQNKNYLSTKEKYEKVIEFIENYDNSNSKLEKIKDFIISKKNSEGKFGKILIFSDLPQSFYEISKILEELKINYCSLDKGNIKEMSKAIQGYKNGDLDILLIESSSEGCGINLENTKYIIFVHKTSEVLYNQMIGRALRPGRTEPLEVYTFINKNEIV